MPSATAPAGWPVWRDCLQAEGRGPRAATVRDNLFSPNVRQSFMQVRWPLRAILIAAILTGLSASGWMRQCCAAGCAVRESHKAKPQGCPCCLKGGSPPKPENCCPFGKSCRDEAEREKNNPSPNGEARGSPQDLPQLDIASDFALLPVTNAGSLLPADHLRPLPPLTPLDMSSCLRN